MDRPVPFLDLKAMLAAQGNELRAALLEVLDSGRFIGGPKVQELEKTLAEFVGVEHAVACASGTAAEQLLLMALGIGPGDEVLVPDFTFAATAEAVRLVGASPVFVDVTPDSFTMDPQAARAALSERVKAIVAVSLFGHPAHLLELEELCREHGIALLEDACQSFGAEVDGQSSGSFGRAGFTSFYPAKPLGGLGDGGMIFCKDDQLAALLRRLRQHGEVGHHLHQELGTNARLDALQCAALLVRARAFPEELKMRQRIAGLYHEALRGTVEVPELREGCRSSWAQYTVRLPDEAQRETFCRELAEEGVPTVVHYPHPLHTQRAFAGPSSRTSKTPVTETLCRQVVSLPFSAYMDPADQERVILAIQSWAQRRDSAAAGTRA
jgi:UDP-2-acetamido-2-deoxy-ribo-hexuluronate aminotransferase